MGPYGTEGTKGNNGYGGDRGDGGNGGDGGVEGDGGGEGDKEGEGQDGDFVNNYDKICAVLEIPHILTQIFAEALAVLKFEL